MLIDNTQNIRYTVDGADPLVENVTITLFNDDTDEELGEFRIKKTKSAAFIRALGEITREVYDVFQAKTNASTRLQNKTSGTIKFDEE